MNQRLAEAGADAFTTIITIPEITQGWTAEIHRKKAGRDHFRACQQFQNVVEDAPENTGLRWPSPPRLATRCCGVDALSMLSVIAAFPINLELLAADPDLHRFVVFDREGSHHSLRSRLWEQRIGTITYRIAVTDTWPESEFLDTGCHGAQSDAIPPRTSQFRFTKWPWGVAAGWLASALRACGPFFHPSLGNQS